MLLIDALFWLAGAWPASIVGPPVPRDVNGVLITVGATIKLVGTVLSVTPTDGHGMGIVFQPTYPSGTAPNAQLPQQGNYLMPLSPLPGKPVFKADPTQLIVGS